MVTARKRLIKQQAVILCLDILGVALLNDLVLSVHLLQSLPIFFVHDVVLVKCFHDQVLDLEGLSEGQLLRGGGKLF